MQGSKNARYGLGQGLQFQLEQVWQQTINHADHFLGLTCGLSLRVTFNQFFALAFVSGFLVFDFGKQRLVLVFLGANITPKLF